MQKPVSLAKIVEALDFQMETSSSYLDRDTGEIHLLGEEELAAAEEGRDLSEYPEWQREIVEQARAVVEDTRQRYLALPDRSEIHEYRFLESFAHSYPDDSISEMLTDAIQGRGAFGRFKEAVNRLGIADEWYEYRHQRLLEVARDWCDAEGIPYSEDRGN